MRNLFIAVGAISTFIVITDGLIKTVTLIKRKMRKEKQRGELVVELRQNAKEEVPTVHISKYLEFESVDITPEQATELIMLLQKIQKKGGLQHE